MEILWKLLRLIFGDGSSPKGFYKKNPVPQNLSPQQMSALSVGLVNSEQTSYFCDSLSTGKPDGEIANNLSDYYDIVDRESAIGILEWFLAGGHRVYFEAIKGMIVGTQTQIDTSELKDPLRISGYVSNLEETIEYCNDLEWCDYIKLSQKSDLCRIHIDAWDMGRMVMVTRSCFECGYISEEEAWQYIFKAYEISKSRYRSWQDFLIGYVYGRGMWAGGDSATDILCFSDRFLNNDESPWKQYQL